MNIISEIISYIKWSNKNTINKDIFENFITLPEDIRYAMQYKWSQIWYNEVKSLLNITFWFTWLYSLIKLHDNDINKQLKILSIFLNQKEDYKVMYNKLLEFHDNNITQKTIIWDKLSTLSRYNFNWLDNGFIKITEELNTLEKKPIILLYAWILSLPFIINSYNGNTIRLFNNKISKNSFKINRKDSNSEWKISQEEINNINSDYVLIDDIYNEWTAYQKSLKVLSELWYKDKLDIYTAITIKKPEW